MNFSKDYHSSLMILLSISFLSVSILYLLPELFTHEFWQLSTIILSQFALYFIGYALIKKKGLPSKKVLIFLISTALISKVLVSFSSPILEDDHYRYLWDGWVWSNDINPYLYPPHDKALDFIHNENRLKVNFLQFKTIYPPIAQYIFYINQLIFSGSLIGLKFILLSFDLASAGVIFLLGGLSPLLMYLYNPLILKEITNSAHIDIAAVFFFLLAIYSFKKERKTFAWASLAFATSIKLFPLALIPYFWIKTKSTLKEVFLFSLVILISFIPFKEAGLSLFHGAWVFSKYWTFNSSIQMLFFELTNNTYLSKIICTFLFLSISLYFILNTKKWSLEVALVAQIAALLLLSPVFNIWYMIWFLPLVFLIKEKTPWFFLGLLLFSGYSFFYSPNSYQLIKNSSFLLFYTVLTYNFRRQIILFLTSILKKMRSKQKVAL